MNKNTEEKQLISDFLEHTKVNPNWSENMYDDILLSGEPIYSSIVHAISRNQPHFLFCLIEQIPQHRLNVLSYELKSQISIFFLVEEHKNYFIKFINTYCSVIKDDQKHIDSLFVNYFYQSLERQEIEKQLVLNEILIERINDYLDPDFSLFKKYVNNKKSTIHSISVYLLYSKLNKEIENDKCDESVKKI